MNNLTAGIGGAVAAVLVAGSAMVFANRNSDERSDEGSAPAKAEVARTHTECSEQRVVKNKEWGTNGVIGTVLGGAAGGALGHQFGGGKGKDVATAVGAVGGAYAGKTIANNKYPDQEVSYRQHCREVPG